MISTFQGRPTHTRLGTQKHFRILHTVIHDESDAVKSFRKAVKQRPNDTFWLVKYGRLARSMGLNLTEAKAVIQAHLKKLRGNSRRGWIESGLRAGYHQAELTA